MGFSADKVPSMRIVRELGWGPHAHVYEAMDQLTDTPVVLKEFRGVCPSGGERERIDIVLGSLRLFNHQRCVPLIRAAVYGDQCFIAYRLVHARPWAAPPANGTTADARLAVLLAGFEPLLELLSAAHRKGLFHCHLSPSNVLQAGDGALTLVDFAAVELSLHLTPPGEPPHTTPGVAPEVYASRTSSERAEVFSLASSLYLLLPRNGTESHDRRTPLSRLADAPGEGTRFSFLEIDEPTPASAPVATPHPVASAWTQPEGLSAPRWEVLQQALSPDPQCRPASVAAFIDHLRQPSRRTAPAVAASAPVSVRRCSACGRIMLGTSAVCLGCGKPTVATTARTQPQAGSRLYFQEMGDWLYEQGKVEESLHNYTEAVHHAPNCDAWRGLGNAATVLRRWQDAEKAYESVLRAAPEDIAARYALAQVQIVQCRYDDASQHLSRIARESTNAAVGLVADMTAVACVALRQDYAAAIGLLNNLQTRFPKEPSIPLAVGEIYCDLGQYDFAAAAGHRVLELHPDHPGALRLMAAVEAVRTRNAAPMPIKPTFLWTALGQHGALAAYLLQAPRQTGTRRLLPFGRGKWT